MMHRSRHLTIATLAAVLALVMAVSPATAASATAVRHGDRTTKVVALTFDDGWSPARTAEIVRILDRHGATATFFPYADAVKRAPDLWRSIAKRYPIGNHTKTHPNLRKLTGPAIFSEINQGRQIIERVTGRTMVPLFRPPYGAWDSRVATQAYRAGFRYLVLWDVDSGDTSKNRTVERVRTRGSAGQAGSIVLLHAGPAVTPPALVDIIRSYKSRGFRFVTVCEILRASCQ
jgi:peptidoglycan-N-acetylglucosamine deacetylase